MTKPDRSASRGKDSRKSDLKEARPLFQAIALGLLLASGLVAAAAMANPTFEPGRPPERPLAVDSHEPASMPLPENGQTHPAKGGANF